MAIGTLGSENDVTQTSEEARNQAETWHSNNFMYNYPMYTVLVPSGKTDCYYHTTHDNIHFDFMVEKGGSLDIEFKAYNAETEEPIVQSPRNSTGYHFFKVEPKKSLNFKFCFDNSFSLVSEKKIRFEIFPDIDMDEWQEQLEEFRQEHEDRKNDTDKLGKSVHPQWNLIHEKSDLMRRRFRKALRTLDQMRSHNAVDEYLMQNKEFRLNFWSITLALLIPIISFLQVIFVKMLFSHTSKI